MYHLAIRKYNKIFAFCSINLFPSEPTSIKAQSSTELKTVIHILNRFPNFFCNESFYVDLEGGCCEAKRRIDLRMLINDTMLCIEIDENQHKK